VSVQLRVDVDGALRQRPGLPGPVASVLAASRNDTLNRERVSELLLQVPGLAARLMGVVNAPFFPIGEPVDSLASACLRLDSPTLERAIIASVLLGQFPPATGERFDRAAFWEHSVGVGVIAQTLAGAIGDDRQLAFTGGLLHDIGRLLLDVHFPREFRSILRYQRRHDTWIRDAEVAVLGIDHCALGASAAEQWNLPADVIEVIRYHHSPESGSIREGATLTVHLADVLARGLEFGNPGDDTIPMLSQVAMKRLGLNWEVLRWALLEADPYLPTARQLVRSTVGAETSVSA